MKGLKVIGVALALLTSSQVMANPISSLISKGFEIKAMSHSNDYGAATILLQKQTTLYVCDVRVIEGEVRGCNKLK